MQGAPYEAMAPRIKSHLENDAKRKTIEAILAKTETHIELQRPRVELRPGGPARGPANAPVTLVEFTDFPCPSCQRARPVLHEIAARHPNNLKLLSPTLP